MTKNSNYKILPKNSVTFKKQDGIKVFWGFTEKSDFQGGGFMKNQYRGGLPKKGGLDNLQI